MTNQDPAGPALLGDPTREPAALPDGFRPTDVGNSFRLIIVCDGRVRYVREWGKFIVYREGVWLLDHGNILVREYAKLTARALLEFAARGDLSIDARDALIGWGKQSEAAARINAMIELVKGVPGMLVEHTELDRRHELLNCVNGTVDLRTGKLLPHNPDHLITKQIPVRYEPSADCPLWLRCLEEWQPDEAMRRYLQQKAGAAATGYAPEEFDIHWGSGGNGKGKFFGALMHVFGPYAVVPHKSLIVATRYEQHETVMADLAGTRFAVGAETDRTARLDEEKIKQLTGGDVLRGRRMREDSWNFEPTHCLALHTNYKPRIRGTDDGIWRRVNLIEWLQSFVGKEDPELPEKLKAEASGILNWIAAGAREWLASGQRFDAPEQVVKASARYRMTANPEHAFLKTWVRHPSPGGFHTTEELYEAFRFWCVADELHDDPPPFVTQDAFAKYLSNFYTAGMGRVDGKQKRGWKDVRIDPQWAAYVAHMRECCADRLGVPLGELAQVAEKRAQIDL